MATVLNFFVQNTYGLIPQNFTNHNTVIDDNGKLVIGYMDAAQLCNSTLVTIGTDATTQIQSSISTDYNRFDNNPRLQGPVINIFNNPKWANPAYIAVLGESGTLTHNAYIYQGLIDTDGSIAWTIDEAAFTDDLCYQNMSMSVCNNQALFNFCTDIVDSDLLVSEYFLADSTPLAENAEQSYYYYPIMAGYADEDDFCGVVCAIADETLAIRSDFVFTVYDQTLGSFSTPTELGLAWATNDFVENCDIALDKLNDGIGIITARWDNSESELVFEFSQSTDGGSTFSTETISTGGSTDFEGAASEEAESHVSIVSGIEGGFIIGYTRKNSSGYARPYIHIVTYNASTGTYTIGAAHACGTPTASWDASTHMIGPLFFKAPSNQEVNIDPAELVYIAYQIGEGVNLYSNYTQVSVRSIGIVIERLDEVALPASVETYADQTAGAGEIVVDVNILETPSDTQDFYSNGYTGTITTEYLDAFSRNGSIIKVRQYEPRDDVYVAGRSSYEETPTTHMVKAFFEPESWAVPAQALNQADFSEYINRDLRKILLPPNFFMSVTYNTSKSYVLLATIWTAEFDSYTYEIRQVVPRFINNQIVYWEANCYNVGNYDVWSRGGGL